MTLGLDGDALAAADGNGCIYLWDTDGALAASFAHPGSRGVIGVAFDPDGNLLAAAGDGHIYLWDVVSGKIAGTYIIPASPTVSAVVFGPGGGVLAAADGNGCTYLWKLSTQPT